MDLATLFTIANAAVLPGWLLLAAAPGWKAGRELIAPVVLPGLMACLYLGLLVVGPGEEASGGDFSSLDGVRALFASDVGLLAGWVHYLCFDLVVGSWEVRDARARGIPHLFVVPCLGLTLMLGPLGWLAYTLVRGAYARSVAVTAGAVATP